MKKGSKAFETHNLSMVFYCSCCCREPLNIAHIFLSLPRHANKIRLEFFNKHKTVKKLKKTYESSISNNTVGGLPRKTREKFMK